MRAFGCKINFDDQQGNASHLDRFSHSIDPPIYFLSSPVQQEGERMDLHSVLHAAEWQRIHIYGSEGPPTALHSLLSLILHPPAVLFISGSETGKIVEVLSKLRGGYCVG